MMWTNGSGGWWLVALPLMIVCMVMMLRMMGQGRGSHGAHSGETYAHRSGGAAHILAERLARGDIDTDEYQRRLSVLQRNDDLDPT